MDAVGHDVDLVVDTVGGAEGHRFLRVVKRGGMSCPVFPGEYHLERAAELGVTVQSAQVHSDGEQLTQIAHLAATGARRIGIDGVFPLSAARQAHERAERGHIQGKLVLDVIGRT